MASAINSGRVKKLLSILLGDLKIRLRSSLKYDIVGYAPCVSLA